MAYEKEAMISPSGEQVTVRNDSFRPERVIDPYTKPRALKSVTETKSGQTPTIESDEAPSTPEASVTLSPQAAALARQRMKVRQSEAKAKAERAQIEKERQELAQLRDLKAKLASGDYSGIDGLFDLNKYAAQKITESQNLSPEQKQLAELQAKIESVEKQHEKEVHTRFESAVNERRTAIKTLSETNPEFAAIKALGAEEAVVQHILQTFEHDGEELTVEVAAKEVLDALKERADKYKSAFVTGEPQVEQPQTEVKQPPTVKQAIRTLSNNMQPTGEAKRVLKPLHLLPESERWAEARRRAEEKLKRGQ
jgi:hypothetical protein